MVLLSRMESRNRETTLRRRHCPSHPYLLRLLLLLLPLHHLPPAPPTRHQSHPTDNAFSSLLFCLAHVHQQRAYRRETFGGVQDLTARDSWTANGVLDYKRADDVAWVFAATGFLLLTSTTPAPTCRCYNSLSSTKSWHGCRRRPRRSRQSSSSGARTDRVPILRRGWLVRDLVASGDGGAG